MQDSDHEEKVDLTKHVKVDDHPQELGVGFVQISVTAATPMVEDAEKGFLDDTIQEESESELAQEEHDELQRNSELEKEVAVAVDEILEEARNETSKRPQQPPPLPPAAKQIQKKKSIDQDEPASVPIKQPKPLKKSDSKEEKNAPTKEPIRKPTIVKPASAIPKSSKEEKPLPPPPPPPPPPACSDQQFESNFDADFEANFEANFEDAFASSEIPKQVVGGRASIPDELEPHQLAKLQDLKESNA